MKRVTAESFPAHFWERVDKTPGLGPNGDCWEWKLSLNHLGYGQVCRLGKQTTAHRVAYDLANDGIPKGLHVLHHCDNPKCVNPAHLWVGTHQENMADMVAKGRHKRVIRVRKAPLLSPEQRKENARLSNAKAYAKRQAESARRRAESGEVQRFGSKTHCKRGHERRAEFMTPKGCCKICPMLKYSLKSRRFNGQSEEEITNYLQNLLLGNIDKLKLSTNHHKATGLKRGRKSLHPAERKKVFQVMLTASQGQELLTLANQAGFKRIGEFLAHHFSL